MAHIWKVKVQAETGETGEVEIRANWEPTHELTRDSVKDAAVAKCYMASGGSHDTRKKYVATDVELVGKAA